MCEPLWALCRQPRAARPPKREATLCPDAAPLSAAWLLAARIASLVTGVTKPSPHPPRSAPSAPWESADHSGSRILREADAAVETPLTPHEDQRGS